jgi:CheY-like chemotaxis protein
MFCTNCGFHIPKDNSYRFCPKCGIQLVFPETPEPAVTETPKVAPEAEAADDTGKKHILIVEDDLFIRELYQKQLEMAGYAVDTAVDGLEGREKVQSQHPDILLLDIMLPKMNGLDLLKNMKQDPKTQDIPVIILSNLGQDTVVEKGLTLGAESYLVKADTTPMEMLHVIQDKIGN